MTSTKVPGTTRQSMERIGDRLRSSTEDIPGTGTPAPESRRARRNLREGGRRGRGSLAVQVIGELLITAGLVLVLFVVWELWWTNIESDRRQEQAMEQLFSGFDAPPVSAGAAAPENYGDPSVLPAGFRTDSNDARILTVAANHAAEGK